MSDDTKFDPDNCFCCIQIENSQHCLLPYATIKQFQTEDATSPTPWEAIFQHHVEHVRKHLNASHSSGTPPNGENHQNTVPPAQSPSESTEAVPDPTQPSGVGAALMDSNLTQAEPPPAYEPCLAVAALSARPGPASHNPNLSVQENLVKRLYYAAIGISDPLSLYGLVRIPELSLVMETCCTRNLVPEKDIPVIRNRDVTSPIIQHVLRDINFAFKIASHSHERLVQYGTIFKLFIDETNCEITFHKVNSLLGIDRIDLVELDNTQTLVHRLNTHLPSNRPYLQFKDHPKTCITNLCIFRLLPSILRTKPQFDLYCHEALQTYALTAYIYLCQRAKSPDLITQQVLQPPLQTEETKPIKQLLTVVRKTMV